jgi:hypothetical protein
MDSNRDTSEVDALTRDPVDGAYHCPACDAPFTRRSNLRRHYTIRKYSLQSSPSDIMGVHDATYSCRHTRNRLPMRDLQPLLRTKVGSTSFVRLSQLGY